MLRNLRSMRGPGNPVLLATVALVLSLAAPLRAQPLADKVPADSLVYVGWLGYDTKSPGFEGSHFQKVMELAEFRKLVDVTLPQLMERIGREDQEAAEAIAVLKPIVGPMLKHPSAIFIGKPMMGPEQQPMPKAGLMVQAGADAGALQQQVQNLLQQAGEQMVQVARQGDLVIVSIGYPQGALPAGEGQSLAAAEAFKGTAPFAVKDASLFAYADVEQLVATVNDGVQFYGDEQAKQNWPKVRDALGLQQMTRLTLSSGFDGKEWVDRMYLGAPAPRKGILAAVESGPISDAALKSIPVTATVAGASKFDVSKFVSTLRGIATEIDPNAARQIDAMFAETSRVIGMDVQKDLLDAVGDEWAYYVDPMTGGRGLGGIVIVNRLKDAAKAEDAFVKIEQLVNAELAKNIKEEGVEIKFKTVQSNGTAVHYLGTPLVSPSWAVKNGYLLIGLFPQMVAGAAEQLGGEKSILDNPQFQAVRKRLGVEQAAEVTFMDLPRTAPDSYATWVAISRLVNFGDVLGIDTPAMILPPLPKLMPHLSPAGSVTWADKDGLHFKAITPFPGATILASDPVGGAVPLFTSILLPSLNRAREQANRAKSASNLRQIGMAAIIVANEEPARKTFPDSLTEIYKKGDLNPEVFIDPSADTAAPPAAVRNNPDAAARWVEENSDYVYIGKGLRINAGPDAILAYEKPTGGEEGINLVFADGHVEWLEMPEATRRINQQRQQRGLNPI